MKRFRVRRDVDLPYERQIYIFARSQNYKKEASKVRQQMDALFLLCGAEYAEALKDYMTTGMTGPAVCDKHFIASLTTLARITKKYYKKFNL